MSSLSILAIIPARGGSKGIPRKNLADLCGKPLIAHSIDAGRELVDQGAVQRAIISTDDNEIAAVARAYGGDVPFMRPAQLASDEAKAIGYVLHALDWFEDKGNPFDAVMILQPTSPIRDTKAIRQAVFDFTAGASETLISCYQEDYINELVMYVDEGDGTLSPKSHLHNKGVRRQEHGPIMVRNGAVYLARSEFVRRTGQLVCDRPMLLRMKKNDSIDVDTQEDLDLLRFVLCR